MLMTRELHVEWTPERITETLTRSRRFVERALLALHYRQSPEQRDGEETGDHDKMGFNRWDKGFMGSLASQIEASDAPEGHRLTDKQLVHAVITLKKYAKQLSRIAAANQQTTEEITQHGQRILPLTNRCRVCDGEGQVVTYFLGESRTEPCPRCGDTPYDR